MTATRASASLARATLPDGDVPRERAPAAPGGASRKDAGIETLRGLAVLLMVAGHVIGSDARSGLELPDDSWWRHAYYTLAPLRMPLFTGISGFVYGLRPASGPGWPRFMAGKLRRLLIPVLVVGGAYLALQSLVPETGAELELHELPQLLVVPFAHFWYLYALAWIFLLVGTLDALGLLSRRWHLLVLLAAALALRASGALATPVLSLWHAQYLLPFFLVGLGVQRVPLRRGWPHAIVLFIVASWGMAVHEAHWLDRHWSSDLERWAVATLVGAVGISLCLHYRRAWRPLAVLGSFSYGIYLLHVFGTAGARILLQRAGVESLLVLGIAGMLAGIGLPVAFERAIERRPWLLLLVLGRRSRAASARPEPSVRLAP